MPAPKRPSSLLAKHEQGLLEENRGLLRQIKNHRSDSFNRLILPKCEVIVRAIGHRMAYDAAMDAGLSPTIIELYAASAIKLDSAWYVEHGVSRAEQDV